MGLTADLSAGEIVEQLVHACRVARIRNIVFMVGRCAAQALWACLPMTVVVSS